MEAAWEAKALALREKARAASRELKSTLRHPHKVEGPQTRLRVGVGVADITPTVPMYLDGYWGERLSTRVHDPLTAKALVFDDGRTRMALVIADIIGYYHQWVGPARSKQSSVPPENVVICTTHTHSSPCFLGMFGPPGALDRKYIDWIGEQMAAAIDAAAARLQPARIGFGRAHLPLENGEIPGFARNWHNPGVLDTELLVMRVVNAESGASIANLLNFGNHPDVLGDRTTEVSSDFLCYVYSDVSAALGGETLVFQRGLGGVEPIPQGVNDPAITDGALRDVAGVATRCALEAAQHIQWCETPRIAYRRVPCRFPITSGEALKANAMGIMPVDVPDGVQYNEMALFEIGLAQFLTVPGEPHPEFIFKLTDMMRGDYKFILALAQDEIGYIVPEEIFNRAGIQELLSAGYDNERVVLAAAAALLGVDGFVAPEILKRGRAQSSSSVM